MLLILLKLTLVDGRASHLLSTPMAHIILVCSVISPSLSINIHPTTIPQPPCQLTLVDITRATFRIDNFALVELVVLPVAGIFYSFASGVFALSVPLIVSPQSSVDVAVPEVHTFTRFLPLIPGAIVILDWVVAVDVDSLALLQPVVPVALVDDHGLFLVCGEAALAVVLSV